MPREDEAGLYWVKWHVDHSQGIPDSEYRRSSDDRDATVSLSPRYAEYMNRESDGSLSDRVFVSFHSNAGGGSARGVLGLYNGNNDPSSATPNQFRWPTPWLRSERRPGRPSGPVRARLVRSWQLSRSIAVISSLVRSTMRMLRTSSTPRSSKPAFTTMRLMRDAARPAGPRRAGQSDLSGVGALFCSGGWRCYADYHVAWQSNQRAIALVGADSVEVSWLAPSANSYAGEAPTGYMVYASTDGYGFDGGRYVAATGPNQSLVIDGLDAAGEVYYFKVAAVNAGGESPASEVVAARPASGPKVLIVNGFDRLDRSLNPREAYGSGQIDRVKPRLSNSMDYSVQAGEAIEAYSANLAIDGSSNESVATAEVSLTNYDAVIWLSGEESSADDTFNANEQFWVASYLAQGRKLFVSGAEIGWDLDNLDNGRSFYENDLRANYISDDAGTYNVQGVAGSIFEGLSFSFDNGSQFYDAQFPDVISPSNGSVSTLSYTGGTGGTAAVQYSSPFGFGQLVKFGFPFEIITTETDRAT